MDAGEDRVVKKGRARRRGVLGVDGKKVPVLCEVTIQSFIGAPYGHPATWCLEIILRPEVHEDLDVDDVVQVKGELGV